MNIPQILFFLAQVFYRFLSGFENRMGYEARREWNIAKAASKNPQFLPQEDAKILEEYYHALDMAAWGKGPLPEKTERITQILNRMPVSTNNEKGAFIAKLGRTSMILMIYVVFMAISGVMYRDLDNEIGAVGIIVLTLCAATGVVSTLGVWNSFASGIRDGGQVLGFKNKFFRVDVHFWETIQNGIVVLIGLLAGMDLIYIIASVTVGQIFHRGEVNKAFDLPYIMKNEITDDPTGKTYGIPLLDIAIRRLSNGYIRVALGVAFIIWIIVNELFFNLQLNIAYVFNAIFG